MNSKELSQKEAELILEKQNEYFNSQATKDVDFCLKVPLKDTRNRL